MTDEEYKGGIDFEMTAAALYDGGWRADEKEDLKDFFDLSEYEVNKICELLSQYEKRKTK